MTKPCGINPQSDRCVQGGPKTPSQCERNPATKRCRKRHKTKAKPKPKPKPKPKAKGALGPTQDPCGAGKLRNPMTNRCVSEKGGVAKKIRMTKDTAVIGGPISISYYEVLFNGVTKRILMFGDAHTHYPYPNEKNVITITTLLKKIIRKSPHCIDLFVEEHVHQKQDYQMAQGRALVGYNSPLQAVRDEFGSCPTHNYTISKCAYDNLRYQNWDLRWGESEGRSKCNPYDELAMEYDFEVAIRKRFPASMAPNIVRYLIGADLPAKAETSIHAFYDEQLATFMDRPAFKDRVMDKGFQDYRKDVLQRQYRKLMSGSDDFPKDFLKTFIATFGKRKLGMELTHVFTDFYLLCRMFQRFNRGKAKNKRTPKRCPITPHQSTKSKTGVIYDTPTYMILYAGHDHITYVETFLGKMFGAKPIFHTRGRQLNKKITLQDIASRKGSPRPKTIDDLFQPFYQV